MSTDETAPEDDAGLVTKVYRTVTPPTGGHPDSEMNTIGWAYFLLLLILLVPLLPFMIILWVVMKLIDFVVAIPGKDESE